MASLSMCECRTCRQRRHTRGPPGRLISPVPEQCTAMQNNQRNLKHWSVPWPQPMSQPHWGDVSVKQTKSGRPGVMPSDFALGPPPDPTPRDRYDQRLLKLVWMETYDAYATFVHKERKEQNVLSFDARAKHRVAIEGWDQDKRLYRVCITGTDPARRYELPEGTGEGEFVHAMLKLEQGLGWVYVRQIEKKQREPGDPLRSVVGFAKLYTDSLRNGSVWGSTFKRCIVFDAFAGCLGRFQALQAYNDRVDPGIRAVLEGRRGVVPMVVFPAGRDPEQLLQPVPLGLKTKLNDGQSEILGKLAWPVDIVQGPPGTGKSTFIVEMLKVCFHTTSWICLSASVTYLCQGRWDTFCLV